MDWESLLKNAQPGEFYTFPADFESNEQSIDADFENNEQEIDAYFEKNEQEMEAGFEDVQTISTGGGTSDHSQLTNRELVDQHPIEAITNLAEELSQKQPAGNYITEEGDPTVPKWAKKTTPDNTLTVEGDAADSKVVGEKLAALDTTIGNIDVLLQTI